MDKKYIFTALIYALTGLIVGTIMAASKNHSQMVTHAHIMLLGFVTTFSYGVCYKLWLNHSVSKVATVQFILHQVGTLMMLTGLFLMYGQVVDANKLELLMALSAVMVIGAMLLMIFQFILRTRTA